MARLPLLTHDELDPEGQAAWDAVVSTRGARTIDADGHLTGPFNGLLHAPGVGLRIAELGAALRYHSSLAQNLLEIAVVTVASRWRAEYEWYMHAELALAQGVAPEVVEAIKQGNEPPFAHDDERIVHAVARELVSDGHITPATYGAAHDLLGTTGLVELVALCGYYTLMSFNLNAFDVPLPEGVTPQWER